MSKNKQKGLKLMYRGENLMDDYVWATPDEIKDYKNKGYKVELVGEETFEGTEVYKIKLIKKPLLVDGKEVENIEMFYFDKENFVPIASEKTEVTGPGAGGVSQILISDYQEIDGVILSRSVSILYRSKAGLRKTDSIGIKLI